MFENSDVPFTIVKETNEKNATSNQHNQYSWKKTLLSPEELSYNIENISLVQEPTETLNLNVTLSQVKSKCKLECDFDCSSCGHKTLVQKTANYCPFCCKYHNKVINFTCDCPVRGNHIVYDITIKFDNYLHEFTSNYSYEVMCKLSRDTTSNKCLFFQEKLREEKIIIFEKCYASKAYGEEFDMTNLDLYFCVRRVDTRNSEMTISTILSFMSKFQNTDIEDCKVILKAKDGQVTVHKSILSHYSEVFRAMLAHEMKEKQDGVVKISDFDCEVVQKMVDYLYTGKLGNITAMIRDLFKLAHQYQLHELCRRCEEYYMFNFDVDNDHIVEILELADLYNLEELKNNAEKFTQRYEEDLTKLPSYQKYLCQSITIEKAVNYLTLADKYKVHDVKIYALNFIKLNFNEMVQSNDFLELFESNPRLMKEIYIHFTQQSN